eukprot:768436-Hanusia_phi.AAC.5
MGMSRFASRKYSDWRKAENGQRGVYRVDGGEKSKGEGWWRWGEAAVKGRASIGWIKPSLVFTPRVARLCSCCLALPHPPGPQGGWAGLKGRGTYNVAKGVGVGSAEELVCHGAVREEKNRNGIKKKLNGSRGRRKARRCCSKGVNDWGWGGDVGRHGVVVSDSRRSSGVDGRVESPRVVKIAFAHELEGTGSIVSCDHEVGG